MNAGIRIVAVRFVAVVFALTLQASAQAGSDADRAMALLAKAQALIVPESATTQPYHLTGKIELYDLAGAPAGDGTLELYWDGISRTSHILTLNHVTQTIIRDHVVYRSPEQAHPPFALRRLMESFLHPLPHLDATSNVTVKIKPANLSGIAADCIVLQPKAALEETVVAPPNVFCLSTQNQALRYTALPPNHSILSNHLEAFGSKMFAHDLTFNQGDIVRAKLHFDAFQPWTPEDSVFKPAPGAIEDPAYLSVAAQSTLVRGKIVAKPSPAYPSIAKASRSAGAVVVAAIISPTGVVEDAEIVSSASALFNKATLDAVTKWRYAPTLLNGKPVALETTLTVNYSFAEKSTLPTTVQRVH